MTIRNLFLGLGLALSSQSVQALAEPQPHLLAKQTGQFRSIAINPETNKKYLHWLVEKKIPYHYEAMFKHAGVEGAQKAEALQLLIDFHKKLQMDALQLSWDRVRGEKVDYKQSREQFAKAGAAVDAALEAKLGKERFLKFRAAESDQALRAELRKIATGSHHSKPSNPDDIRAIYALMKKHLLDEHGVLKSDNNKEYPAMIADAKASLSKEQSAIVEARWGRKGAFPVRAYAPRILAPYMVSSAPR